MDDNSQCGWEYTHGLNPKNPRAADNERYRPQWLPVVPEYIKDYPGDLAGRTQIVPEGVKVLWGDND
jgi:hypothetical protein